MSFLRWLRARLTARDDSEHEQALVRLVIGTLILFYFVYHIAFGDAEAGWLGIKSYGLLFLAASLLIFAAIVISPEQNPARRVLGILVDMGTLTVALTVSGRFAAILVAIYAWVIVGNGARFGARYMWFACVLALSGYGWTVATGEYWARVPELAFAFAGFLVIVPAYVAILLDRLKRANLALRAQAETMAHMATHDALTGLPNRVLFFDRLVQATALSQRSGKHVVLLYIDLDGFKNVNDGMGHDTGDKLLVRVARLIEPHIRKHDTLARLGGDEFVVLLNQLKFPDGVLRVANAVLREVESIRDIEGRPIHLTASVGISCWPISNIESGPEVVVQRADAAMYEAKHSGRNRWVADPAVAAELTPKSEAPAGALLDR